MLGNSKLLKSNMFWVGILYFAEGFPYGIFYDVFPVYFRQQGMDLKSIGLLGLLGLVWSMKFVWAPAVDYFRHHRRWIFVMDVLMGGILFLFAGQFQEISLNWIIFWLFLFALFSATSDIAIDGYTIELLEKSELGIANGLRIAVYRVGILGSGFVLVLSGQVSWAVGYFVGGVILCLFGSFCLAAPREKICRTEVQGAVKSELMVLLRHPGGIAVVCLFVFGCLWVLDAKLKLFKPYFGLVMLILSGGVVAASYFYARKWNNANVVLREELNKGPLFGAVFELIQRPSIIPLVLFILVFKLGDTAMGFMVKPFWVDSGFSATEIGLVSVNIGLGLSIAGGLVGGWFTDRFGIYKGLWILGLFQAVSNLGYALAAMMVPHAVDGIPIELNHRVIIYSASMVESFTGGLGNGPFLAFLMAIVNKQRAASEYALLSSIFALSRQLSYWASGYGAQSMGYASYFLLTFFLAFPAYLLLPWIKRTLDSLPEERKQ